MTNVNITSPVGRIVQGSVYDLTGKTDEKTKAPRLGKDGKQIMDCYFALAIPKGAEKGWWETAWGQQILAVGAAEHPASYQRPDFAWKITDGDSAVVNKANRKPCDQEGFKGNWVLRFSSGFVPKTYTMLGRTQADGTAALLEPGAIRPGFFVQVNFNVTGNDETTRNPGVYLNHSMVCLIAYGDPIQFGPDVTQAGFGVTGPLPAGASLTPTAGFVPPATLPVAGTPPAPALTAVAAPGVPAALPVAAPSLTPVAPHTAILGAGAPPPPGVVAPPPAAVPVRRMTAKATATYEAYIASNWTDALLVQHGMMEP